MFYLISYFNGLASSGSFFWFCALVGSGMFLIQFFLNTLGVADADSFDISDSTYSHDGGLDSSDVRKFKWLSLQAIAGFLMMFGWTALTCQIEFGLQNTATIGISIAVGLFAVFVLQLILKLANKIQSAGRPFRIEDTIGKEAYVYQRIPKDGMGKISVSLHNLTHEINAVAHHTDELTSFTRVKIIGKTNDDTVVVSLL